MKGESEKLWSDEYSNWIVGLLHQYNIPLNEWGAGESRPVTDLLNELLSGEATLTVTESGELLRLTEVVGIDIFYHDEEGKTLKLREDRQEFADGRIRKRNLFFSISEKVKPGEKPEESAYRALKEELGLIGKSPLEDLGINEIQRKSISYPGILSLHKVQAYRTYLHSEQFDPEGYVEVQPDKKTYFIWDEIM